METAAFDTLAAARELEAAGMDRHLAEVTALNMHKAGTAHLDQLATKADLENHQLATEAQAGEATARDRGQAGEATARDRGQAGEPPARDQGRPRGAQGGTQDGHAQDRGRHRDHERRFRARGREVPVIAKPESRNLGDLVDLALDGERALVVDTRPGGTSWTGEPHPRTGGGGGRRPPRPRPAAWRPGGHPRRQPGRVPGGDPRHHAGGPRRGAGQHPPPPRDRPARAPGLGRPARALRRGHERPSRRDRADGPRRHRPAPTRPRPPARPPRARTKSR